MLKLLACFVIFPLAIASSVRSTSITYKAVAIKWLHKSYK